MVLSAKQRAALEPSDFGLPEERRYPIPDKNHVIQAIRFFDRCELEKKKELAANINKKVKEFNMKLKFGKGSFSRYIARENLVISPKEKYDFIVTDASHVGTISPIIGGVAPKYDTYEDGIKAAMAFATDDIYIEETDDDVPMVEWVVKDTHTKCTLEQLENWVNEVLFNVPEKTMERYTTEKMDNSLLPFSLDYETDKKYPAEWESNFDKARKFVDSIISSPGKDDSEKARLIEFFFRDLGYDTRYLLVAYLYKSGRLGVINQLSEEIHRKVGIKFTHTRARFIPYDEVDKADPIPNSKGFKQEELRKLDYFFDANFDNESMCTGPHVMVWSSDSACSCCNTDMILNAKLYMTRMLLKHEISAYYIKHRPSEKSMYYTVAIFVKRSEKIYKCGIVNKDGDSILVMYPLEHDREIDINRTNDVISHSLTAQYLNMSSGIKKHMEFIAPNKQLCIETVDLKKTKVRIRDFIKSIKVDTNGDVSFDMSDNLSFDKYEEVHKVMNMNRDAKNYEALKQDLCFVFAMISTIEYEYMNETRGKNKGGVKPANYDEMVRLRALLISDFKVNLRFIMQKEPRFNFMKYYTENSTNPNVYRIDKKMMEMSSQALHLLFRSIVSVVI